MKIFPSDVTGKIAMCDIDWALEKWFWMLCGNWKHSSCFRWCFSSMFCLFLMLKIILNHKKIEKNAANFLSSYIKRKFSHQNIFFSLCVCGNFVTWKAYFCCSLIHSMSRWNIVENTFCWHTALSFSWALASLTSIVRKKLFLFSFSVKFQK